MSAEAIINLYWTTLWPLFAFIFAFALFLILKAFLISRFNGWSLAKKFDKGATWRSDRELIQWLREMKPYEFEAYIAELFKKLGYKSEAVGRSHDGGVDVEIEKDGVRGYIQCKKYITSTVGVSEVRDFYGALADRLLNGQAYFITTNKFTLEAKKFAEDKPIELVDSFGLLKYIKMVQDVEPEVSDISVKLCPKCSSPLIERSGRHGKFLGCSAYPECEYTKSL